VGDLSTPGGAADDKWGVPSSGALADLFNTDSGAERMLQILEADRVSDVRCNRHDRIFFTDETGPKQMDRVFGTPESYASFINQLMALTDIGFSRLDDVTHGVLEGSFRADRTSIKGSVIILTSELTRGEPVLVIRKQPKSRISLDQMLSQGMMDQPMRNFLELAVRGRLNMLISGGSGAGKTTLAKALAAYIDPAQRVMTCEEIDELHLNDHLPNVVAATTFVERDARGAVVREEGLDDLVRYAFRMRADRIWVGETRGREAYALVKACTSGHDGSVTTIHANDAGSAIKQLTSYVMEANVPEDVARQRVAQAFHIAVQIQQVRLGRRVITEIVELEDVHEGTEQRRNELWKYDWKTETFAQVGTPTPRLARALARYNVNVRDAYDVRR
jgi:pilus assembly protein CpaF